jgi:hypothetical protein
VLSELKTLLQGDEDRLLRGLYQGYPVVASKNGQLLLLVVERPPRYRMLIAEESGMTRVLDGMGIHDEAKVGDAELDARYVIRNVGSAEARELLTADFAERLKALAPFLELELTDRHYRLLKPFDRGMDVPGTLNALIELVEMSCAGPR